MIIFISIINILAILSVKVTGNNEVVGMAGSNNKRLAEDIEILNPGIFVIPKYEGLTLINW